MATYFDQSLVQIKIFEGCVPWMYLDSVGKVTVGVGLMLPDAAAAGALAFLVGAAAASADQIGDDFARVAALAPNKLPAFYRSDNSPQLSQDLIDTKLSGVLTGFESTVRAGVQGYDALPGNVKMALLDMAYNLGPAGLLKGYPVMLRAVAAGNWAQAAIQCARGGISAARNSWTRQQSRPRLDWGHLSRSGRAGPLLLRLRKSNHHSSQSVSSAECLVESERLSGIVIQYC